MEPGETKEHWERVWADSDPGELSWFEAAPGASLRMIEGLELSTDAPIVDVGGGASPLAGTLLERGFTDVTVVDVSAPALAKAREEIGADAARVDWVVADVRSHDFGRRFALWHDRAVFHFLVDAADRDLYLGALERSLESGGHVVLATFGPEGPTSCSGLPTARYDAAELAEVFAPVATLVSDRLEVHETPGGNEQQFTYVHLATR
jgi:SAM-dependent methyltransferase